MKAIPGSVEESVEFTDSALIGEDTSWVEEAFSPFGKTTSYITLILSSHVTCVDALCCVFVYVFLCHHGVSTYLVVSLLSY